MNSKRRLLNYSGSILRLVIITIINHNITDESHFLFGFLDWLYSRQTRAFPEWRPDHEEIINTLGESVLLINFNMHPNLFLYITGERCRFTESLNRVCKYLNISEKDFSPESADASKRLALINIMQRLKSIQNTILPPTKKVDLYTRGEEYP